MASLAQALEAFGKIYEAGPVTARTTLRSRIQNLQGRFGIPEATKVGTGGRSDYDADALSQLGFCFEMAELGVGPAQQAAAINDHWPKLGKTFALEWKKPLGAKEPKEQTRVVLAISSMSCAWRGRDAKLQSTVERLIEAQPDLLEEAPQLRELLSLNLAKKRSYPVLITKGAGKTGKEATESAVEIVRVVKDDTDLGAAIRSAETHAAHVATINVTKLVWRLRVSLDEE